MFNHKARLGCGTAGMAALALALWGQSPRTGAQVASFHSDIDNSTQQYALYVPKSFDAAKRYPLVISLHQEESNHRIDLRTLFGVPNRLGGEPDTEDLRYFPQVRDVDYIVACPYARGTMGYRGIAEKDVYSVLADVKRRFPIDEDRVYLTGISMGGSGALRLALTRPDVWAAVAPLCPLADEDAMQLAGNGISLPIRLFHGEQDPLVPVEASRRWQRKLQDSGVNADYIEYPTVRHNVWDMAYRNGAIFDWFGSYRRNRYPERVHFSTHTYRYPAAYWVQIDGMATGFVASIDAAWTGKAELRVQTQNVEGFTLTVPPEHTAPSVVAVDDTPVRMKPASTMSFRRVGGKWQTGRFEPAGKRPGAEGPISEAVLGRQIYVYGSGGIKTEGELTERRMVAERAASWSSARSRLSVTLPVKADSAVTDQDIESSDLILFGNAETNSLIARFAGSLPLALSPAAADYGLLFIAPAGKHYALVNSGLPWWTGAEEAHREQNSLEPEQVRLLRTFGDFILFKGSLGNVVSEGRFDRNWKVPPEAAAKLTAAGTVTIH